jgi:hypothetical protein
VEAGLVELLFQVVMEIEEVTGVILYLAQLLQPEAGAVRLDKILV